MSLEQDIVLKSQCQTQTVLSHPLFTVNILNIHQKRDFKIISVRTFGNLNADTTTQIMIALTEFFKNTVDTNPAYALLDSSQTEVWTLQQMQICAEYFRAIRPILATRLVGTVVKAADQEVDSYLLSTFRKLYTPVRPVSWYRNPEEAWKFITEWEHAISP
jgi:hypothetical protein